MDEEWPQVCPKVMSSVGGLESSSSLQKNGMDYMWLITGACGVRERGRGCRGEGRVG